MRITSVRASARPILRCFALLAVLCGVAQAISLRADEPAKPATGAARLASGQAVDYTIHYDRNSLQDSLRVENGLIALTTSGALLRFELPAVRLVREQVDAEEVTCLGRGEGTTILAGLKGGRVCRVDPMTLDLTDVTKLPVPPRWIGWRRAEVGRPAGLVVVTRPTKSVSRDDAGLTPRDQAYTMVHDLAVNKTFTLKEKATKFLLDDAGRLWLGSDRGEWGGLVTRIDLAQGTMTEIKPPPDRKPNGVAVWDGVYGFIELRDGQV